MIAKLFDTSFQFDYIANLVIVNQIGFAIVRLAIVVIHPSLLKEI
jgi:hypothetical protein